MTIMFEGDLFLGYNTGACTVYILTTQFTYCTVLITCVCDIANLSRQVRYFQSSLEPTRPLTQWHATNRLR